MPGWGVSIQQLFQGGLSGILLGLVTVFGGGDHGAGRHSPAVRLIAGAAISTRLPAGVEPRRAGRGGRPMAVAPIATAQVAALGSSFFLTPMLTSLWQSKKTARQQKTGRGLRQKKNSWNAWLFLAFGFGCPARGGKHGRFQ